MTALGALTATDVYVGTTRARHKAIWYTDNKEEFREAALRDGERKSTYDYEKVLDLRPSVTHNVDKTKEVDLQGGKRVGEQANIEMANKIARITKLRPGIRK
jgi:hypothetical protein